MGREAVVPQSGGRRIRIIADEYVDREFGTGALKITPGEEPGRRGAGSWPGAGGREWDGVGQGTPACPLISALCPPPPSPLS